MQSELEWGQDGRSTQITGVGGRLKYVYDDDEIWKQITVEGGPKSTLIHSNL